jgi:hypothetical protein
VEQFERLIPAAWRPMLVTEFQSRQRKRKRKPRTIDELLDQTGEDGTHSILDIERVSSVRAFRAIVPLAPEGLVAIFGTHRPTHEMVAQAAQAGRLYQFYGRWEGVYLIVYQESEPNEIYIEGASGD